MTALWYVVIVLGLAVALLFYRLTRLEKLVMKERANSTKMAGAIGAVIATCPGYNHTPNERSDLVVRVRELYEDADAMREWAERL